MIEDCSTAYKTGRRLRDGLCEQAAAKALAGSGRMGGAVDQ
ncbi:MULTISPECIES: hypothetical protein [Kribbella]